MKDQNSELTNKYTDWDHFNDLLESNINQSVQPKTADQLERELNAFRTAIRKLHGIVRLLSKQS
jgi:hypothetical protein